MRNTAESLQIFDQLYQFFRIFLMESVMNRNRNNDRLLLSPVLLQILRAPETHTGCARFQSGHGATSVRNLSFRSQCQRTVSMEKHLADPLHAGRIRLQMMNGQRAGKRKSEPYDGIAPERDLIAMHKSDMWT